MKFANLMSTFFRKDDGLMLKLKKITKSYKTGDEVVQALKGIDIEFRNNEFVSILRSKWLWKDYFIKYNWWFRSVYKW